MKSVVCSLLTAAVCLSSAFAEEKTTDTSLFLKEEISVKSDTGVTTLLPGTPVTRCGESKEGVKVKTAEGVTTTVKETQLTTDQAESQRLAQTDASNQGAAQAQVAKALEERRQSEARNAALINQTAAASAASSSSSSTPSSSGSTQSLTRTEIKYKAEDAGVTVKPPKFNTKKKK